jgi:hypothetical protein
MHFKKLVLYLILIFGIIPLGVSASECSLYEQSHPTFLINGAHLSTGKCTSCALCHINRVFVGTPKSCVTCHNGDPSRNTVGRSSVHVPTGFIECDGCHTTTSFTVGEKMNHTLVAAQRCDSCHNTTYKSQGARAKPKDHPLTTLDCGSSGCHNTRTFDK